MPHKTGKGTYKGYQSPETSGWPQPIRDEVRHVYGAWRVKHPGEAHTIKSRGARIAWSAAKRKYPKLYRQHVSQVKRGVRQEHREHPELPVSTAKKLVSDHMKEDPNAYAKPVRHAKSTLQPVRVTPAKTRAGRRRQARDLREAARQQRRWAATAENEYHSELARSKRKRKEGYPIEAQDIRNDAGLARDFAGYRKKKADRYDLEAGRIAAIKGE